MQKKIIAVAALMLALVLLFVACGKGPTLVTKEGYEYPLVTDEEGNTVVNDNGELVIYVTDENGKYVKDANGEPQTNSVTFPDSIATGSTLETPEYKITFPEDWYIGDMNRAFQEDNENTYVEIVDLGEVEAMSSIDSIFSEKKQQAEEIAKQAEQAYEGSTYTLDYGEKTLTKQELDCRTVTFSMQQSDGTQLYYSQIFYFIYQGHLFKIDYICTDGKQDTSYDIAEILNANLVMKTVVEETEE